MIIRSVKIFLTALILSGYANSQKNNMSVEYLSTESNDGNLTGYAPVNGLNMYFEIHGEGTPLVLIHGGGSTIQTTFGKVLNKLAENNKVIAVEMQAHGHTADIDRPLSFEKDADDIAELLKYLKIDKANIFGFSNGASTTLQFAIRHPELTNKIIVASTFYKKSGAPDWFWEMMANPTFAGMPQPYKDAFLKINPDTNALHRMYERDVARMQSFPDITDEQIRSIKVPALIIIGDKDVTTIEHANEMHKLISNSQLEIIPGGHGEYIGELTTPQDTTKIRTTVEMINNFLD